MLIRQRSSNFSQFSPDVWGIVESEGTRIDFEVSEDEILEFSLMLVDFADDCIRQFSRNTDVDADKLLELSSDLLNELNERIKQ